MSLKRVCEEHANLVSSQFIITLLLFYTLLKYYFKVSFYLKAILYIAKDEYFYGD